MTPEQHWLPRGESPWLMCPWGWVSLPVLVVPELCDFPSVCLLLFPPLSGWLLEICG